MKWIDRQLVEKAKKQSPVIMEISRSFEEQVEYLKKGLLKGKLPLSSLQKEYTVKVSPHQLLVPLDTWRFSIERMVKGTTYEMTQPIRFNGKVSASFSTENSCLQGFCLTPEYGFHFVNDNSLARKMLICDGDWDIPLNLNDLETLNYWASKLPEIWKVVNLNSLGTVKLPRDCPYKEFFKEEVTNKVEKMITAGLLKTLL
jgi:hypothetical protein